VPFLYFFVNLQLGFVFVVFNLFGEEEEKEEEKKEKQNHGGIAMTMAKERWK